MEVLKPNCDIDSVHALMQAEESVDTEDAILREETLIHQLDAAVNRGECSREVAEAYLYKARMTGQMAVELSQSA